MTKREMDCEQKCSAISRGKWDMRPPVGIPGRDDFCIDCVCEKCNRHFLIAGEIKEHVIACMN